jgi:hypothetical protein
MVVNTAATNETNSKKAKTMATIFGIAYSILVNAILPLVIYQLLKSYTSLSDFWALVLSGIPPMIDALVGVIRKGRVDLIAGLALLSIAVSVVLILLGGSPRLLLIRESYYTAAFGLAYLVSFLFPRPLGFYFARHFVTGNVPERVKNFNSYWQYSEFRFSMRLSTAVWGISFLLEAAIRTYLVFTLTIPQFLIISPFVFYGMLSGVMLWTMLYSRHGRKQQEKAMSIARAAQEAQAASTDNIIA